MGNIFRCGHAFERLNFNNFPRWIIIIRFIAINNNPELPLENIIICRCGGIPGSWFPCR